MLAIISRINDSCHATAAYQIFSDIAKALCGYHAGGTALRLPRRAVNAPLMPA